MWSYVCVFPWRLWECLLPTLTLPLLHEKLVRARTIGPNVLAVNLVLSLTSSQGGHDAPALSSRTNPGRSVYHALTICHRDCRPLRLLRWPASLNFSI